MKAYFKTVGDDVRRLTSSLKDAPGPKASLSLTHSAPTRNAAFSLVELLVVLAIIGILATIGLPALRGLGGSNDIAAANRQLVDDLSYARFKAINERTTVYVVFVSQDILTPNWNNQQKLEVAKKADLQYTSYALFAKRSLGDQPGPGNARYVTPWKTLPNGVFILTNKFDITAAQAPDSSRALIPVAKRPFSYVDIPFPTVTDKLIKMPVLAFDYQGRLVAFDNTGRPRAAEEFVIPLVKGSIIYPQESRDLTKQRSLDPAEIIETPKNNYTNNPAIRIDWLTGRARWCGPRKWIMRLYVCPTISKRGATALVRNSAFRRSGSVGGFTMVEIALSIAVVAFALVAILGVLPTGMTVQKDNRDDNVINQEGRYWLEAIRSGARGIEDLTNYVESITITNSKKSVVINSTGGILNLKGTALRPVDIIGLLSTPKYTGVETNAVIAHVKAITGPASEKGPLTNEFSFRYEMQVEITPAFAYPPAFAADQLTTAKNDNPFRLNVGLNDNLHEVRLIFRWPLVQRGTGWFVGNNRKTFRGRIAGGFTAETNATAVVRTTMNTTFGIPVLTMVPNTFLVNNVLNAP